MGVCSQRLHPRVFRPVAARDRFGGLFHRMVAGLERADPLADAAARALESTPPHEWVPRLEHAVRHRAGPPELVELARAAHTVPAWVDWSKVERAGEVLYRSGALGGITLGFRSLVYGYAAPAGNKPLMFSGRLTADTPRRLAETARFVAAVGGPLGMRPGGEGFEVTLKVRLMHARVRQLALVDPRWDRRRWGIPINQHDMLATMLLFSTVYLQGLERLGVHLTTREWDDYVHLWRWAGVVVGVDPDLVPADVDEALEMGDFVRATQGPPDDDSRALVGALLTPPTPADHRPGVDPRRDRVMARRLANRRLLAESICRALIDPQTADGLELARHPFELGVDGVRLALTAFERLRLTVPAVHTYALDRGSRHWTEQVDRNLRGRPAVFAPPLGLLGSPPSFEPR